MPKNIAKSKRLYVYLTEDEYDCLKDCAETNKLSISSYARKLILE